MADISHLTAKSADTVSKAVDNAMDKQVQSNGDVKPGISIAMGPVEEMDVDTPGKPITNGTSNSKRKASMGNGKSYKDASVSEEEDDDAPLVSWANIHNECHSSGRIDKSSSRSAERPRKQPSPMTRKTTSHLQKRSLSLSGQQPRR